MIGNALFLPKLWVWDMNYFMITIKIMIRIHIPSKIRNKRMQHSRSSKVNNWKFISVGRSYSKRTTIVYWLNNFMSCRDWHFVSHIPLAEIMEGRTHETTKKWHFSDPPRAFRGNQPTVGLKSKNPLKIIFKKIMKAYYDNICKRALLNSPTNSRGWRSGRLGRRSVHHVWRASNKGSVPRRS